MMAEAREMTIPASDDAVAACSETLPPHRAIRSFTLRGGRITRAQQIAMQRLLPKFGLDSHEYCNQPLCFTTLFGRAANTNLEIGFGNGAALLHAAIEHPNANYLGIEVHRPGVGHLLTQLEATRLTNVRIFHADAVAVLQRAIAARALHHIYLYFPDPWPKKRHHKRRILQPAFARLLADKLVPGGELHFATDWEEYGHYALSQLEAVASFTNTAGAGNFALRARRPLTKFEQRGLRLGHKIYDIVMQKCA